MVHIVGISGSLRRASCNTGILRALAKSLPTGHTLDIVVPDLPLFNSDLELPQSVKDFRARLKRADAFIFATPEYNYSISSPLKNALDWGSRGDADGNLFNDKAGATVSAGGMSGGMRATLHLADAAVYLNLHLLNHPQLPLKIFENPSPLDKDGNLIDEKAVEAHKKLLEAFLTWHTRIARK